MALRLSDLSLSLRQRLTICFATRVLRVRPDSLVYICRDIGLDMTTACRVLPITFDIPHAEAKMLAFRSPAWGRKTVDATLELHERWWAGL